MNGVHDQGGMHGFGPVQADPQEPVFHAPWEGRVLGLQRALLYTRAWNLDMFRHAQERLPAGTYLGVSYYHRWLLALTASAVEHGLVSRDELQAGHARDAGPAVSRTLSGRDAAAAFVRAPFGREPAGPARFAPGDRVRTRQINPPGHTRLPRYARDKSGTVDRVLGCHVFPDAAAAGQGDDPQWLYAVAFDARELWGADADPATVISIDAFEPYLEAA